MFKKIIYIIFSVIVLLLVFFVSRKAIISKEVIDRSREAVETKNYDYFLKNSTTYSKEASLVLKNDNAEARFYRTYLQSVEDDNKYSFNYQIIVINVNKDNVKLARNRGENGEAKIVYGIDTYEVSNDLNTYDYDSYYMFSATAIIKANNTNKEDLTSMFYNAGLASSTVHEVDMISHIDSIKLYDCNGNVFLSSDTDVLEKESSTYLLDNEKLNKDFMKDENEGYTVDELNENLYPDKAKKMPWVFTVAVFVLLVIIYFILFIRKRKKITDVDYAKYLKGYKPNDKDVL